MLKDSKLVAFIAVTDSRRAKSFYGTALGLRMKSEDNAAIVFNASGTTLRLQKVESVAPHSYTALGWEVPDLRSVINALSERGVVFERFAGMEQDDVGVWTAPGGAQVAWFKDPDGNLLSLVQSP